MPPLRTRSTYKQDSCQFNQNDDSSIGKRNSKRYFNQNFKNCEEYQKNKKFKKIEQDQKNNECSDWRIQFKQYIEKDDKFLNKAVKIKQIGTKYPKQKQIIIHKNNSNSKRKNENLCSICIDEYSQISGLIKCGHKFCFECILEWTKSSTNCPCCRTQFTEIIKITINHFKIQTSRQIIQVEERLLHVNELDYLVCLECEDGGDEGLLLICNMCDFYCCHVYCDLTLNVFPSDQWHCKYCNQVLEVDNQAESAGLPERTQRSSNKSDIIHNQSEQSQCESDKQSLNILQSANNFLISNKKNNKNYNNH